MSEKEVVITEDNYDENTFEAVGSTAEPMEPEHQRQADDEGSAQADDQQSTAGGVEKNIAHVLSAL